MTTRKCWHNRTGQAHGCGGPSVVASTMWESNPPLSYSSLGWTDSEQLLVVGNGFTIEEQGPNTLAHTWQTGDRRGGDVKT